MRKVFLLLLFGLAELVTFAQTKTAAGKVTDASGNPLTGATVQVKNQKVATVTNARGEFSIAIPANAKALLFSYTGMTTREIEIGSETNFNVTLSTIDRSIDEVIVVGYTTLRKKELTGNVAQISGAKLRDQPLQSFEQGLSGRAAGINVNIPNGVVGNAPIIRVRGTNSISLSSSPLIVIDGIPAFTGDAGSGNTAQNILGDINPNDIESLEILKDAAASAIYGSRASAGVVLITTKKGKAGSAKVNYDVWAGYVKAYNLIPVLGAQAFTDLKNEALVNAGTPPNNTTLGFYTMKDANGNLVDTRWYDEIYRKGFSQSHNLSISGASDKTSYFFSAGFTDQQGMFKNNDYERLNGRLTLDHNVNNWLKIGGTFSYTKSKNTGLNTGSTGAAFNTSGAARLGFALAPNVGPYNNDGSYNINTTSNTLGQGNNKSALALTNVTLLLNKNKFSVISDRILANIYGQVKIAKRLFFKSLYGVDYLRVTNAEFYNNIHGDGVQFNGQAQNTSQDLDRWNWQNILNYSTQISNSHTLNMLAGAEQQYSNTNSWAVNRRNVSDPFFDEFQGGFTEIAYQGGVLAENFLQSYFGSLNYDYKKKYFLTFNGRRDGYSAFAKKWGNFFGGSVGWTLSEEKFWQPLENVFNNFKLRASYGQVGNFLGISSYAYQSLFSAGLYGNNATIFYSQAGNSKLTWEKSKKLDIGFVTSLLRNKVNVEFAYYRNNIDDLVLDEPQAPSRGIPGTPANTIKGNVGAMVNKGIELTIDARVISGNKFSWNTSFNITTLSNQVTALANNNADIIVSTGGLEQPSVIRVGESIGSFLVVKSDGVNPLNGQRIVVLKDGTRVQYNHAAAAASRWTKVADGTVSRAPTQITDGILMGPALPKFFGGLENTFRWKYFDFNVLIYFSGGNYVYNGTKAGLHDNRNWNNASDALERWTKPGDVAKWPKVVFGDNISNGSGLVISNNVEKGGFAKIRNLTIGFTLPKEVVAKANISSVRFYVSGFNLHTFTKYSGFDPEVQTNGEGGGVATTQVTNGAPGVDRNTAGMARTINFGLNIGF